MVPIETDEGIQPAKGNAKGLFHRGRAGAAFWSHSVARRWGSAGLARLFVMPDHLIDDEAQEFLAEFGVELGILCQSPQPGDLRMFAARIFAL